MPEPLPSEDVYHGTMISVRAVTLPSPSGGTTRFEVVDHPGAAAVVAVRTPSPGDPQREPLVALVRQARPAVGRDLWELPAGLVSAEEQGQPLETAKRELLEETGASASEWHLLTREYSSPGFTNETITLFLATDITLPADAQPKDATEIAQVAWIPLGEAIQRCQSGETADGKTMLGLSLAREALRQYPSESETSMPLDPTNLPQERSTRYRDSSREEAGLAVAEAGPDTVASRFDTSLKMENMLLEEYNYANLTAYQALEDRARIFTTYLTTVFTILSVLAGAGGVLSQIGGTKFSVDAVLPFMVLGLVFIAMLGAAFFVNLVRLRQAYSGSIIAMNTVKEYFIAHFEPQVGDIAKAFAWRMKTIPRTERFGSVSFVISGIVAAGTSLSLGAAAGLLYYILGGVENTLPGPTWLQGVVLGVLVVLLVVLIHVPVYRRTLNFSKPLEKALASMNEMRAQLGLPPL